ncbi:MAG: tetratricopeptide repeat protein [Dorea sp.]|nr:tetratricopeptide repeat protein [Dorea sp.]
MRCRYCGAEIPEGIMYCEECGGEVQIVPDYNPLEDMLAAHVKDALKNSGRSSRGGVRSRANAEYQNSGRTSALRSSSGRMAGGRTSALRSPSGRMAGGRTSALRSPSGRMAGGRTGYIAGNRTAALQNGGRTGYVTDRRLRGSTELLKEEREAQRRQAERRRALKKKKRRKALAILFFLLAVTAGITVVFYINSYSGMVYLGNRALRNGGYTKAEEYFQRAVGKDKEKAEAYTGLSKVYIGQNDVNSAENLFLNVIKEQPDNAAVYKAAFEFYLDVKQPMGIPTLLKEANNSITEELSEYVVSEPEFSLDEKETFDDVQQLTLTSKAGEIRYTTDGSMPDTKSAVFTEPIQLGEGSNKIKAIVINKEGVPSQTAEKEFVIEIPIEDAPAVSPSTGQYNFENPIEIKVPEGYTAYYTTDGTDPTTASTPYKEPVAMPKGETLFKAILVTKSGRVSGITTRNYVRE